jgi:hypothetical protein
MYIHTYHSIPEGVAEASQMFLQDTHVLPKFLSCEEYWNTADVTSAVNPLVTFYNIPGRKGILFNAFVLNTTRDTGHESK